MPRDPRLYLDDILEAAAKIRDYTTGFDYPRFAADGRTQDAVVRNLEIIGEAAGRLPDEAKAGAPDIEWRKIVGLRKVLAHEYFGVTLPMIWGVWEHRINDLALFGL
jgi:uncharacterized protein with HEPN domain